MILLALCEVATFALRSIHALWIVLIFHPVMAYWRMRQRIALWRLRRLYARLAR